MKRPSKEKSALEVDELYVNDSGRTFCGELRCAGESCYTTGRDGGGYGHRVYRIGMSDVLAAENAPELQGFVYKCENCGKVAPAHIKRDRQLARKVSQR